MMSASALFLGTQNFLGRAKSFLWRKRCRGRRSSTSLQSPCLACLPLSSSWRYSYIFSRKDYDYKCTDFSFTCQVLLQRFSNQNMMFAVIVASKYEMPIDTAEDLLKSGQPYFCVFLSGWSPILAWPCHWITKRSHHRRWRYHHRLLDYQSPHISKKIPRISPSWHQRPTRPTKPGRLMKPTRPTRPKRPTIVSLRYHEIIFITSREHLENIERTSREHLENM